MAFYRMQSGQNEFYFQLANLEPAKEEYVFWKDGQVPPIPIKEAVSGITPREAYWDKTGTRQVVGYRADRSYIRDIIVTQGGINTQYLFAFKKRDTDQLNAEISNIVNLQRKSPLTFNFKFRKTGQGKETIRVVVAMQEIGLPQNVQQSSTPYQTPLEPQISTIVPQSVQNPITPIKVPEIVSNKFTGVLQQGVVFGVPNMQNVVVLNDIESRIYSASCDYVKEGKLSEQRYIELWNECAKKEFNTLHSENRIKQIYRELYSK